MNTDINSIFADYLLRGSEFVSASVFAAEGHTPAAEGSRMLITIDGQSSGTVGGGAIEKDVINKALEIFSARKSRVITYDLESGSPVKDDEKTGMPCGGRVSIFLEYFGSPDSLYIFGCGHAGEALVKITVGLGFAVSCIDGRKEYADRIRKQYQVSVYQDFPEIDPDRENYIVIASYSHENDFEILSKIIAGRIDFKYLGIVASSRKWKLMKEKLLAEFGKGIDFYRIYSPAGIDTGGRTPADIAVSIAAELNSVRNGTEGLLHLRDKKSQQ